jgi:hypothetical protein
VKKLEIDFLNSKTLRKYTLEKTERAIKNKQSRNTTNIGHTRHRTKTNKTKKQNK